MPWKFRSNEDLSLTSRIEINCAQSILLKTKWTIINYVNGTELNLSVETADEDLIIPAETLFNGLYKIELVVRIIDSPSIVQSSSAVYVEMSRSTIDVKMTASSNLIVRHNYREDLLLDPGHFSFDRNRMIYNEEANETLYSVYSSFNLDIF